MIKYKELLSIEFLMEISTCYSKYMSILQETDNQNK